MENANASFHLNSSDDDIRQHSAMSKEAQADLATATALDPRESTTEENHYHLIKVRIRPAI